MTNVFRRALEREPLTLVYVPAVERNNKPVRAHWQRCRLATADVALSSGVVLADYLQVLTSGFNTSDGNAAFGDETPAPLTVREFDRSGVQPDWN